jgi:hypothetical protein
MKQEGSEPSLIFPGVKSASGHFLVEQLVGVQRDEVQQDE